MFHCDNPPCIESCDERNALYKTPDGVVLIDSQYCPSHIECKKCYEMCPYDAIDINPFTSKPEKCDFCYDRIIEGEQPVCVQSCMGKAMIFGDLNDKKSEISKAVKRRQVKAINPELGAMPLVFYLINGIESKFNPLKNYEPSKTKSRTRIGDKLSHENLKQEDSKIVYTVDSMCPSECGILVKVTDGVAKKIYGNPHSLINSGTLCAKGAAGLQLTYSPHRIKTPLMRTGLRGEDKWRAITWEEAAEYLTKKLIDIKQRYGPESVFFNGGDMSDGIAYERLFRAYGTPNIYHHGSICDLNRQWGQSIMLGDSRPLPDVQRPLMIADDQGRVHLKSHHDAKLILNIGTNPFVSTRFNYMSSGIPGAKADNNCKYIVVDPSHTNSAAHADIWLPIIPGTDADLLAAMLFYIINNDSKDYPSQRYIDHNFLDNYTVGWPAFKAAFLAYTNRRDPSNKLNYFSLDWAAERTGISRLDIRKLSHLFGITKPASIEIGMHGTAHHTNGDVTSILMSALCLITGNLDVPGGLVFIGAQKPKKGTKTSGNSFLQKTVIRHVNDRELSGKLSELHKDRYGKHMTARKGVVTNHPHAIQKGVFLNHGPFKGYRYPVKAYITRAGNPVITASNTKDWVDALTAKNDNGEYKVELTAYIDTHISVTGRYADIVFPEAGFLERMGLSSVYTMSPEIALKDKAIDPLYSSKTSFEFMVYMSEAFIKNGDPDITAEDFMKRYDSEEDFINEMLIDTPGFYNIGEPLPYPNLPEGCRIIGTPEKPTAMMNGKIIQKGEPLTVNWLRNNHGVAVWPASYFRYKNADGSPSGILPKTNSKKFEFQFSNLEKMNKRYGLHLPTTFYWSENKWNPKNSAYKNIAKEYPFQLISGRVHHSMTMTVVCSYLSETETECMEPLNDAFSYTLPEMKDIPNTSGLADDNKAYFKSGSVSIPVFALNRLDGESMGIKTGDIISLENPQRKKISGKAFLTEEIMPGVIKTAFGPGGQKASGLGFMNNTCDYTPNVNELHDPDNFNSITGNPGFGDIMVKILKNT